MMDLTLIKSISASPSKDGYILLIADYDAEADKENLSAVHKRNREIVFSKEQMDMLNEVQNLITENKNQ